MDHAPHRDGANQHTHSGLVVGDSIWLRAIGDRLELGLLGAIQRPERTLRTDTTRMGESGDCCNRATVK